MYTLFIVIIAIFCLALILLVIIQNSKGGGLASNLQAANIATSFMGAQGGADFVEKATWACISVIAIFTFIANIYLKADLTPDSNAGDSGLKMKSAVESAKSSTPARGGDAPKK